MTMRHWITSFRCWEWRSTYGTRCVRAQGRIERRRKERCGPLGRRGILARGLRSESDMHDLTTDSDRQSAVEFARRAAEAWSARLGPRLLGVYLMGSLAHGGYGVRYSDIDVAIVAADPLTPDDLAALRAEAAAVSAEHAAKLSIFWTDRTFAVGRFPPLD